MKDELAFHVDERTAQLMALGMSAEDARAEAIRRLGRTYADTERRLVDSAELKERRLDMREKLREFRNKQRQTVLDSELK